MDYEIIALFLKTMRAVTINCELIWPGLMWPYCINGSYCLPEIFTVFIVSKATVKVYCMKNYACQHIHLQTLLIN